MFEGVLGGKIGRKISVPEPIMPEEAKRRAPINSPEDTIDREEVSIGDKSMLLDE